MTERKGDRVSEDLKAGSQALMHAVLEWIGSHQEKGTFKTMGPVVAIAGPLIGGNAGKAALLLGGVATAAQMLDVNGLKERGITADVVRNAASNAASTAATRALSDKGVPLHEESTQAFVHQAVGVVMDKVQGLLGMGKEKAAGIVSNPEVSEKLEAMRSSPLGQSALRQAEVAAKAIGQSMGTVAGKIQPQGKASVEAVDSPRAPDNIPFTPGPGNVGRAI